MTFIKDFFKFMAFIFKMIFKLFKLALVVTGLITVVRCGSGFTKKGDKVYYNGEEVGEDFVVLNDQFAKDDSVVYYKMKSIANADLETFEALSPNYGKDKNRVFYCNEERDVKNLYLSKKQKINVLDEADASSFRMLDGQDYGYAADKYRGYYMGHSFAVKDPATLALIDNLFVKDKFQVYCQRLAVAGSDPSTFQNILSNYYKDKSRIYVLKNEGVLTVIPCQYASFQPIEFPYSKDATGIFYVDKKIPGADAATFTRLENNYCKDIRSAYFEDKKIEGADAASFTVDKAYENTTGESYYAKDKNHVFHKTTLFTEAEVKTFQALEEGYSKDSKHVFYNQKIIKGADPVTFETFGHQVGGGDSKDKNRQYLKGERSED